MASKTPTEKIAALMARIRSAHGHHMSHEDGGQEDESRVSRFCKIETNDGKVLTSGARDKDGKFVKDCVNVLGYDIAEGKTAEQTSVSPLIVYVPADADIQLFSHAQLKTKLKISLLDANPEETVFYKELTFSEAQLILTPFYGGNYRALAFAYQKKEATESLSDGEGKSKGTMQSELVIGGA